MEKRMSAVAALAVALLAGCGKSGGEAKYEALCRKAGMAEEAVKTMTAVYSKASASEREDMMKSMQSVVDNPPQAGEDDD